MKTTKGMARWLGLGVLFAGVVGVDGVYGDIKVGPTTDVRRGTDPFAASLISTMPGSLVIVPDNLYVGVSGNGELEINAGSTLTGTDGFVGYQTGWDGEVTVRGAGSMWSSIGELTVGRAGNGRLNIEDGGEVSGVGVFVGREVAGDGFVNLVGAGSRLTSFGDLIVGGDGLQGIMNVDDGAVVEAGSGVSRAVELGGSDGSFGSIVLDGVGSAMVSTASKLVVGNFGGTGVFGLLNGAQATSAEAEIAFFDHTSNGLVVVDGEGSHWDVGGEVTVGGGHRGQRGTASS